MWLRVKATVLVVSLAAFLLVDRIVPSVHIEAVAGELARLLAVLAVVSVFLVPVFSDRYAPALPVGLWVTLYFVCKSAGSEQEIPWVGPADVPSVLYEFGAIVMLIGLSVNLMQAVRDWFNAFDTLLLGDFSGQTSMVEPDSPELKRFIMQGRRTGNSVTALVVALRRGDLEPTTAKAIDEMLSTIAQRVLGSRLAASISGSLRRTDLLVPVKRRGSFAVFCVNTDEQNLHRLAERIEKSVQADLHGGVEFGVASFPDDAVSVEDLLHQAEANLLNGGKGLDTHQGLNEVQDVG